MQKFFQQLGVDIFAGEMQVFSPLDGLEIAKIHAYSPKEVEQIIAQMDNSEWSELSLEQRVDAMEKFANAVEAQSADLANIIRIDAGKTNAEAAGEVTNFVSVVRTNCINALEKKFDDLGVMARKKTYLPVGNVGLITSYNFPLAVAGWTTAPALLVGNAVVWKPSEKTPLVALAIEAIFEQVISYKILRVVNGCRETGKVLVASADMISATGSVAMAQAILQNYAGKVPPILEAGGNNALIISQNNSAENLDFALQSLLKSFLAGGGQKCTNTRRLFVHAEIYDDFVGKLKTAIEKFIATGNIGNPDAEFGYAPLIDADAYKMFETAKAGEVSFGKRVLADEFQNAYYVEPAICELPQQLEIMHHECFAPLLYVVKYSDFAQAIADVNAPQNAGLVNGVFTQSRVEVDEFAAKNGAGHTVINSPTGTGTPAHGMGFGGNKQSGAGEILNMEDQLRAFSNGAKRVATNSTIKLS